MVPPHNKEKAGSRQLTYFYPNDSIQIHIRVLMVYTSNSIQTLLPRLLTSTTMY
ncbi:hypothetical protein [Aeromonas phage Akh-2]|nr:hypothetical protein [Aeromonas phage Akh-2]